MEENSESPQQAVDKKQSRFGKLQHNLLGDSAAIPNIGDFRAPSCIPGSNHVEDVQQLLRGGSDKNLRVPQCGRRSAPPLLDGLSNLTYFQTLIVLSSDTEDERCLCNEFRNEIGDNDLPMTSTDVTVSTTDSDFHMNADIDTQSSGGASLWTEEELTDITSGNRRTQFDSNIPKKATQSNIITRSRQYQEADLKISADAGMKSPVNGGGLLQSQLLKHNVQDAGPIQTRATRKIASTKNKSKGKKSTSIPIGSDVSKKAPVLNIGASKRKKKGAAISPAVVDVVFGDLQKSMPDVEEIRRKREEDAAKCGRTVRSIQQPSNEVRCHSTAAADSEGNFFKKDMKATLSSQSPECHLPLTPRLLSTGVYKEAMDATKELPEQVHNVEKPPTIDSSIKQVQQNLSQQQSTTSAPKIAMCKSMMGKDLAQEAGTEEAYVPLLEKVDAYKRSPSPTIYSREKVSKRRDSRKSFSPDRRRRSYREPSVDSIPASPWYSESRRIERFESRSLGRSRHRSPAYLKDRSEWIRARDYEKYYQNIRSNDSRRTHRGAGTTKTDSVEEHRHKRRRHSSSSDGGYRKQSLESPYRSHKAQRRSPSISKSRSPTNSVPRQLGHEVDRNARALLVLKKEDIASLSPALDRRTRRYKQAVLEAEKSKRTDDGKKAYYLTLDSEGKPCGPGKKAWLSDINKLATWLDPSCLHIRKQTYEDMCIFKDRLNDNFEYSGNLNEDYLRSLAGKAVTRKRTELISLIERNGKRPTNVDTKVWERLENIANSKQREERKENGRYANSCRRTLGRTGSLGVDGIRERLRERYGTSPDPHELREEMERDKGFGGKQEGRSAVQKRHGKECVDDVLEEEPIQTRPHSSGSEDYDSEEGQYARQQIVLRSAFMETSESIGRLHRREKEVVASESGMETGSAKLFERKFGNNSTKDEYIARLEAELRSVRGHTAEASGCHKTLPCETVVRRVSGNDSFQRSYAGEISSGRRSGTRK